MITLRYERLAGVTRRLARAVRFQIAFLADDRGSLTEKYLALFLGVDVRRLTQFRTRGLPLQHARPLADLLEPPLEVGKLLELLAEIPVTDDPGQIAMSAIE